MVAEILLENISGVDVGSSLWAKSGRGSKKLPEVVEIQKWLNANGYNAGNPDGLYGKTTANAIRAFQKASGLKVDGDVGPGTLKAMQGSAPAAQQPKQPPAQPATQEPAQQTKQQTAQPATQEPAQQTTNTKEPAAQPKQQPAQQAAQTPKQQSTTQPKQQPADQTQQQPAQQQTQQPKQQTQTAMSPDKAAERIQQLLAKANENVLMNVLDNALNETKVILEALTPAEFKELQSLLKIVSKNPKYADIVKRANTVISKQSGQVDRGNIRADSNSTAYTVNGKPATRAEYEKKFGTDVSGRYRDYKNLTAQIKNLARKARDEKQSWMADVLNDPKSKYYKDGVIDFPDEPGYAPELKAIDDKYKKIGDDLKSQAEDLASDPEVKKLIDNGGDRFDQMFSSDKKKDPFDDMFQTDAPKSNKSNTKTKSSYKSSTKVTKTGGTTVSGGGKTIRKAARYDYNDTGKELLAQAEDLEKQSRKWAKNWHSENPGQKKMAHVRQPEYKEMRDKIRDLKTQAEREKVEVEPGSVTRIENQDLSRIKTLAGL